MPAVLAAAIATVAPTVANMIIIKAASLIRANHGRSLPRAYVTAETITTACEMVSTRRTPDRRADIPGRGLSGAVCIGGESRIARVRPFGGAISNRARRPPRPRGAQFLRANRRR